MRKSILHPFAAALCSFMFLHAAAAAEHDWSPAPVPRYLIGFWALGHKCNVPSKQLRITTHTMQFGTNLPIRFKYHPPDDGRDIAGLELDGYRPVWTYSRLDNVIFDYGVSRSEGDIYYRCSARRTGRK